MNLFEDSNEWSDKLAPIAVKYKDRKHPLNHKNSYQLLVAVVLSAQDSDANINKIGPILFEAFPNIESLAVSNTNELLPYINTVKNFQNKANWLLEIAKKLKKDDNIPLTIHGLTVLKGVGRKSANAIRKESNNSAEGIIVDLHVIRVVNKMD